MTLSWTAPAEDAESVDGYEILRRRPMEGESALATLVADTESTATTYTDATANEAGVRYVYRVKALRGDDVSLWSNFDKIDLPADYVPDPTPTPEPESTSDDQAPTGLSATLADGGGVALSWTAPSEDADSVTGYEILRAVGRRRVHHPGGRHRKHDHLLHRRHRDRGGGNLRLPGQGHPGGRPKRGVRAGPGPNPP